MTTEINETSGQAHPYWYEWFVGLIEVVKLLNPDDKVESVAFQVPSIKVWDDVVVQLKDGRRCYQVKHSRVKKNLAFGSLVETDADGNSLLGKLFRGRQDSSLTDPSTTLILYTNRSDGTSWSKLQNGNRRPPLIEFWQKLKSETVGASSLANISMLPEYEDGWQEWIDCFDAASDSDVIAFLRQLEIRTREDDLDDMENRIRGLLASAFGVSIEKAAPLFDALTRALRKWTTGHPGVTAETLCKALTIPPAPKEFAQAPPPPTPFFPTRIPVATDLESNLRSNNELPVVFLTGEPGSGKTSVVSWLANRRTEDAFQGTIGIRFFCFEPIRPEKPFIAPDSSRVTPEDLWFSLLTQLRRGLEGRLHELAVPLRNSFLQWTEAREHVLRLADVLGDQLGQRFVISVDGIDHAARASQVQPKQIEDFFASLPTPDELDGKNVRLLVAGQPPEHYVEQYPAWLQGGHPLVHRIDLPTLKRSDIRALLDDSKTRIPAVQSDDAVRVIDELAKGNTLAIVFAVAESESTDSLESLQTRLEQRRLSTGVTDYYRSIWDSALQIAPDVSCSLAGAISLARKPVTPKQLEEAFTDWKKPKAWWHEILSQLGPLLVACEDGFQIRHNDVRVFLASTFQMHSESKRRSVASQLASYFRSANCDRLSAHLQLFDLLARAHREPEMAQVFDVDWVIEGSVLGIELSQLQDEGEEAAANLSKAGNWSNVISVACALQTLNRRSEDADIFPELEALIELPPFLPAEASVRPFAQWDHEEFRQLVWDASELVEGGERNRAIGLLSRWLDGLTLNQIVESLPDVGSRMPLSRADDPFRLDELAKGEFEGLGSLCGKLDWAMNCDLESEPSGLVTDALFEFEKGFVHAVTEATQAGSVDQLFAIHRPVFIASWELAVRNLAESERWPLVAELLALLDREAVSPSFLAESTWFALRSGVYKTHPHWLTPLDEPQYGLPSTAEYIAHHDIRFVPLISISRALGWTRIGFDPAEIAASVLTAFDPSGEFQDSAVMALILQAAAILGRIEGQTADGDWRKAADVVSKRHVKQVLSALWEDPVIRSSWPFPVGTVAASIAEQLSDYCRHLGEEYDIAAFEAALPFAEQHVLGPKHRAIWNVVMRHGRLDVLRKWTDQYLGSKGEVWSWSHYEARETVDELVPLAQSIGQNELAEYASERARWLAIAYRDRKEYSFEQVSRWFLKAAENDPEIWPCYGWRLWQLCIICNDKDGDNRDEQKILNGISAAALRCGASQWWQLISTTLERASSEYWHYQTGERFVSGTRIAIEQGTRISEEDILPIWSLAICLSYWFDEGDNALLRDLREMLLDNASSHRKEEFQQKLHAISPNISRRNDETEFDDDDHDAVAATSSKVTTPRSDAEFWREIDALVARLKSKDYRWGYYGHLFEIARQRAFLHGNDVILDGLAIQQNMHARWSFGGGDLNQIEWKELPPENRDITWETVVVEFLKVLLNTHSAEVIRAALEGMHALVDHNPDVIRDLYDAMDNEWSRRWLLNASESWAVLYSDSVANIRDHLQLGIEQGDLDSRLQAWVVLCRNCDTLGEERVLFPIPETPVLSPSDVDKFDVPLLTIPPTIQGNVRLANRFSAAHSMLHCLAIFGFQFSSLEGLIANGLKEFQDATEAHLDQRGPHRYRDMFTTPLDTEKAVGHAISQILSSDWCSQQDIAQLCQAFLANEDSWVYRRRPRVVASIDEWPSEEGYGYEGVEASVMEERLLKVATSASLPCGWRVFAATVVDFTWDKDFVLSYWFESTSDFLLVEPARRPTCAGGRSFIWWIGDPVEQDLDRFVSSLFVGGRQRLHYCHSEIRPPIIWRDIFGWKPNESDPLEWCFRGQPIARYERLHGVLRDDAQGPKYRQPVLARWIITDDAFEQVQSTIGELRARHAFVASPFKDK